MKMKLITMKILEEVKTKVSNTLNKYFSLKEKLYMDKGASLICKDKEGKTNKSIEIVANHIDPNLDNPISFPEFNIVKSVSTDGSYSLHKVHSLTLDADNEPTEGSKKLIVSGTLYEILNDIQTKINNLREDMESRTLFDDKLIGYHTKGLIIDYIK